MLKYKTIDIIFEFWSFFNPQRKKDFLFLLLFMIVSSFAEVISIGSIVPLLGILLEVSSSSNNSYFISFFKKFNLINEEYLLLAFLSLFCALAVLSGTLRVYVLWLSSNLTHQIGADLSFKIFSRALYREYEKQIHVKTSEVINGATVKVDQVLSGVNAALVFLNATIMFVFISLTTVLSLLVVLG